MCLCVCMHAWQEGIIMGKKVFVKHCVFKFLQLLCVASNSVFMCVEGRQAGVCVFVCVVGTLCV